MDRQLRILIVDDDKATRTFLSEALIDEGYEVKAASDGQHGLRLIDNFNPDLILLDMFMPVMSGTDFIAVYKQLSHPAPVIGLSARNLNKRRLENMGIADFLEKPFNLDDLLHHIELLTQ